MTDYPYDLPSEQQKKFDFTPLDGLSEEDLYERLAATGRELKAFDNSYFERLKSYRADVRKALGMKEEKATEKKVMRGQGVSKDEVLTYINTNAAHGSGVELTARQITDAFPGKSVSSALKKIKDEKLCWVHDLGRGINKGLRFKQWAPESDEQPSVATGKGKKNK